MNDNVIITKYKPVNSYLNFFFQLYLRFNENKSFTRKIRQITFV